MKVIFKFGMCVLLVGLFFGYVKCISIGGVVSVFGGDLLYLSFIHAFKTQPFTILTASICFTMVWYRLNKKEG